MNNTGICWADYSWNPIVGCDEGCEFCYARERSAPRVGKLLKCDDCLNFRPHLHKERLMGSKAPAAVKTPGVVFADSMGDWYGPRVDAEWRAGAMQAMREAHWHSYVVLTKRPDLIGMPEITQLAELAPPSMWLGVSVTGVDDLWRVERLVEIMRGMDDARTGVSVPRIRAVVSVEPLLRTAGGWEPHQRGWPEIDWVICGALTGPGGKQPTWGDRESVRSWAGRSGAALWEKDNLSGERIQQRPQAMREWLGEVPLLR